MGEDKVFEERVKLVAVTLNALALGVIGLAVLRPLTDASGASGPVQAIWIGAGLAMHLAAHYVLGMLKRKTR